MALMRRANCERTVPEDKVNEYLEMGYSLIKDKEVIKKGRAQTKDDLLVALAAAERENAALKAELEQLKKLKCPYCDKEYANEKTLAKHIKDAHPEITEQ